MEQLPIQQLLEGRESELSLVRNRLREQRIVTLTGPGGIGKTALAMRVVADVEALFPASVRRVELARLSAGAGSLDAVASLLGAPSFEAWLAALADRRMLVLLDNCEHLIALAAQVAERLVASCSAATVLATSREPLAVPAEYLVTIGPLELPRPGDPRAAASVRLFLERAAAAGAAPATDSELPDVAVLCRRLDGVPLAIELAASRARTVTAREMVEGLDQRLDLLGRRRPQGAERHRSLRAAIDWSYELLDAPARELWEQLAVFAGPFTVEQVQAVHGEGTTRLDSIDGLQELVDRSLVQAEQREGATRYVLLETLRDYARERLVQSGAHDAVQERLLAHTLNTVMAVPEAAASRWDGSELNRLLAAYPSMRTGIGWALDHDSSPERALGLLMMCWGVVHQGHSAEIRSLGTSVLERWDDPVLRFWPEAATTVATACLLLGDVEQAEALAERALQHATADGMAAITARRTLGLVARAAGDPLAARGWFEEGASIAAERNLEAFALELDVFAAQLVGGEDGVARCRAAIAAAQVADAPLLEAWGRIGEGHLLLGVDAAAAIATLDQALALSLRLEYPWGIGSSERLLGIAHLHAGRPELASRHLDAAIVHFADRSEAAELGLALRSASDAIEAAGQTEAAEQIRAGAGRIGGLTVLSDGQPMGLPTGGDAPGEPILERAREELARIGTSLAAAGAKSLRSGEPEAGSEARFVHEGATWSIAFAGREIRVRDAKGLHDLARLLREPGRELHCFELIGTPGIEGDGGPVLDEAARRAYQLRILELESEIEEADDANDPGRGERARSELEAVTAELSAAFGLGGRARTQGRAAERARSSVAHRIRAAIRKLDDELPELAQHLRNAIRTGFYCSYQPDRDLAWQLED